MLMYSIFDKKAIEYGPIFFAKNDAVAVRQFNNFMHGESILYPDDYALYKVGDFDTETGAIVPAIQCIINSQMEA